MHIINVNANVRCEPNEIIPTVVFNKIHLKAFKTKIKIAKWMEAKKNNKNDPAATTAKLDTVANRPK